MLGEVFIMTPKDKANEIFNKFYFAKNKDGYHSMNRYRTRECAYIALNEIIDQWEYINIYLADGSGELNPDLKYWYEVKRELQKISV